jgi:hypothetical protein
MTESAKYTNYFVGVIIEWKRLFRVHDALQSCRDQSLTKWAIAKGAAKYKGVFEFN